MDTKRIGSQTSIENLKTQTTGAQQVGKSEKGEDAKRSKSGRLQEESVGVSISNASLRASRDRAKALEIARNTPDVREDRVAALKVKIANGTYKVDPEKIADGMLREAIRERLAEEASL